MIHVFSIEIECYGGSGGGGGEHFRYLTDTNNG